MTDRLAEHWQLAEALIEPCRQASKAIIDIYREDATEVSIKADSTPVTEADHRSQDILLDHLRVLTPELPVLSEEGDLPSFEDRRQWQRYWLIDPLDGTREFIHRTGEFTINIALIDEGVPVLGVLAVPLEHAIYMGVPGYRAACYRRDSIDRIAASPLTPDAVRVLSGSRHFSGALADCVKKLEQEFGAVASIKAGSALKFCRLAEGRGDIYPRFARCCEWDTAAGQALLEAAGGKVVDLQFNPLRYNSKKSLVSPHFYAVADSTVRWEAILNPGNGN